MQCDNDIAQRIEWGGDPSANNYDISKLFGSGGSLETLARANPVPEFDDIVEFYEYLVMKDSRKVDHPIDHDTGELGAPLPPDAELAEHRYFVRGTLQHGSATGKIADFFEKFDSDAEAARMSGDNRTFIEGGKYYLLGIADAVCAWVAWRTDIAKPLAYVEALAFAFKMTRLVWHTKSGIGADLVKHIEEQLSTPEMLATGVLDGLENVPMAILCDSSACDDAMFEKFCKLYRAMLPTCYLAAWKENSDAALEQGRTMHRSIEMCYNSMYDPNDKRFDTVEMHQFYDFHVNWVLPRGLRPFRTELSMAHSPHAVARDDGYVCGTIDMLYLDERDQVWLIDWKCSRELSQRSFKKGDVGHGPCEGLQNCNIEKYAMQAGVYEKMLTANTEFRVVYRGIACFHPNQTGFQIVTVIDYQDRCEKLMAYFAQ